MPAGKGKHLLLSVPDFNLADKNQGETPLTSYLRLGRPFEPNEDVGEDLATMVTDFVDDTRPRAGYPSQDHYDGYGSGGAAEAVLDKDGNPAGSGSAGYTSQLHSLGGWRDHSDGNRVSTTRGDKVEVIRGNYKMLVLGRQDDPEDAAGWDVSGGHIEDMGLAPGGVTEIKWVQDKWSGTWKIVEQTEKGEVHEIFHGNVKEEFYGDTVESITGSEVAGDTEDAWYTTPLGSWPTSVFNADGTRTSASIYQPNPHLIERTWARKIESYTGSSTKRVPEIIEDTYATTISETVDATTINETVDATTITSKVTADTVTETISVGSTTTTLTGGATEIWAGGFCEIFAGANLSLRLAASAEISIALLAIEAFIGVAFQVFIGKCWELKIGWFNEIRLGPSTEIMTSEAKELVLGESSWTGLTKKEKAAAIFLN